MCVVVGVRLPAETPSGPWRTGRNTNGTHPSRAEDGVRTDVTLVGTPQGGPREPRVRLPPEGSPTLWSEGVRTPPTRLWTDVVEDRGGRRVSRPGTCAGRCGSCFCGTPPATSSTCTRWRTRPTWASGRTYSGRHVHPRTGPRRSRTQKSGSGVGLVVHGQSCGVGGLWSTGEGTWD